MQIYTFENMKQNYLGGDFYFVASSLDEAKSMAYRFEKEHNEKCNSMSDYIIKFNYLSVKVTELKPGFLSLNRLFHK